MSRPHGVWVKAVLVAGLLGGGTPAAGAGEEAIGFELTPPRLAFLEGEVSFWRAGADDWAPARVNTALAAGDELYTAAGANLELQIGPRAYLRAGEETQLSLTSLEPDFLQLRVTAGRVSLDLRSRRASQTIEIGTPNAAFTIEHSGYYRVEVSGDTTSFISRRGGRATVASASGAFAALAPSEQVVITGGEAPQIETYAAPRLDAWDRWNYARTDSQLDAVSARYVPSGVYGIDDLDQWGTWRVVPSYGALWVPRAVPVGWAPYSTGRWMYDPFYGWTWVDDAPWGWAPYHYGRWVFVSSYWAWAPGPIVVRPYYAPALVAFYGSRGFSLGVSIGSPFVGWVPLGWGEPLVPWWGPVGCRGVPHWAGWGGPRIVNNVVIHRKTVINVRQIQHYQNLHVHRAVVAVERGHFGRRAVGEARIAKVDVRRLEPVHGELGLTPHRESLVAARGRGKHPPKEALERSVVATREPRARAVPGLEERRRDARSKRAGKGGAPEGEAAAPAARPPARLVSPPRGGRVLERPAFGKRGGAERATPAPAPRFEQMRERDGEQRAKRRREIVGPGEVPPPPLGRARPEGEARRRPQALPPSDLPGEPASRVYRPRRERPPREAGGPSPQRGEELAAPGAEPLPEPQRGPKRKRDTEGGGRRGRK